MLRRRSSKNQQTNEKKDQNVVKKILPKFLEFLETDIWILPVAHFIELNSIVFDREQGDPSIYESVHQKFADLINSLIGSYCQDASINEKELVSTLTVSTKGSSMSYKKKVLLEPIIAAQDFNVFVPMMMRKNIELQLQALKMLEHLCELPSSLKLDEDDAALWNILFNEDESERLILISVLKQSKAEWEEEQRLREEKWQKQLDEVLSDSLNERQHLLELKDIEQKLVDEAIKLVSNFFYYKEAKN